MVRRLALVLVAVASTAAAQTPPLPPTASTLCRQEGQNEQGRLLAADRAANRTSDPTAIVAAAKKIMRNCAAGIDVATASMRERSDLAALYVYTNDTSKAESVVADMLKAKGSESDRADARVAAIRLAIAKWDPFAGPNPDGERFAAEIDRMSDSVIAQKIAGHYALLGRYEYADLDDPIHNQATIVLGLARRALQLNALPMRPAVAATPTRREIPAVNSAYVTMSQAYRSLARAAGDMLNADSALKILDEADRVVGSVFWPSHDDIVTAKRMYQLVGTPASAIAGKWWVNAPDGSTAKLGDGKVSILQFTATWCVPCKKSYPPMLRLMGKYKGKPVESVMATSLYGYLGDKRNLTPEQEVEADREYYAKEHELPFPVAINPAPARFEQDPQEARYAVSGIPEIVIIDRKGVIRATVVGWDKGNEARFAAFIDKLLAEKP